jgi:stage V sporulation protein SpoVS
MMGRLLNAGKGSILLLCHGHKGASKALAVLHAASLQLQRKHACTLLCQVGPQEADSGQLRVLARLWPYAGVWQPQPVGGQAAADGAGDADEQTADAEGQADTPAAAATTSTPGTPSSSAQPPRRTTKHASFLRRGLVGRLPSPAALPPPVRHRPAVAIPAVISRHCVFNASRVTQPRVLAGELAAAVARKGRARVRAAGGLAVLHALQAVRLAAVVLGRAHGQAVVMHVEQVKQKAGQQQQPQQETAGEEEQQEVAQVQERVTYYAITLLAAQLDAEATPSTCVFPVPKRWQQQQQADAATFGAGVPGSSPG